MRSVGVDIAKIGASAVALVVDGEPTRAKSWQAERKQDSEPAKLVEWERWLLFQFSIYKPDVIAVEQLAVFMNKKTIRALGHFEGVALLAARKYGAIVVNPTIGSSRNIALDIAANAKKEIAWEAIKKMYPGFKFGRFDQGGGDKADAMTHALAAPTHLERR